MATKASAHLQEQLDNLPAKPGVYLLKDKYGKIVYVGKAINLRARVRSYFHASAGDSPKTQRWERAMRRDWIFPHSFDLDDKGHASVPANLERSWGFASNAIAAARITMRELPDVESLALTEVRAGMPVRQATFNRNAIESQARGSSTWDELIAQTPVVDAPVAAAPQAHGGFLRYPAIDWTWSPSLRSNIGSRDGFFLTDVQLKGGARLQWTPRTSLSAIAALSVIGNLDELTETESSSLPNVRSDLESYQRKSRPLYLEALTLDHFRKLRPALYSKVSAGILEDMFGGVIGEVLYAPLDWPVSIGVDLAWVRQREYEQRLGFLDYSTVTGHVSSYWHTGWNGLLVETSFGRYLARDVGATLKLTRIFRSGLSISVFATKTNVSAAEFGEGSFDKGFSVRFPFGRSRANRPADTVSIDYRFLTRDGGQKLNLSRRLVDELGITQGLAWED